MTATTTVTCNAGGYTQITTADTGEALIYNPSDAGSNLAIHIASSAPVAASEAFMMLAPDEAYRRTSDVTGHVYGKALNSNRDIKVVITQ